MPYDHDASTAGHEAWTSDAPVGWPGKRSLTAGLTTTLQRKAAGTGAPSTPEAPPRQAAPDSAAPFWFAGASASAGAPLAAPVQAKMERAFAADFSQVRVHEGEAAGQVGATAYAQGDQLHFAPGAYDPRSARGQELIGHELAHVVQQREGRVPGPQGKGGNLVADAGLEAEADRLGAAAARGEVVRTGGPLLGGGGGGGGALQRKIAAGQEAFVDRRVIGVAGPGTILAVLGAGYTVAFDNGATFYAGADDLDFIDDGGASSGPAKKGSSEPTQVPSKEPSKEPSKDSSAASSSGPRLDKPVQVFLKGRNVAVKEVTFTLTPEHVADTSALYRDVIATCGEQLPMLATKPVVCFTIWCGPKPIPRTGAWPEEPAPRGELNLGVAFDGRNAPVVDEALVTIVKDLAPTLVVPCSQINDTHTKDKDSTPVDPDAELVRYVSIENLTRQQKLTQVQAALAENQAYTLVLIDPSFAQGGGQVQMVQIVEYLGTQGHAFAIDHTIPSHHVTVYRCRKVRIAYVGMAPNSATMDKLPNQGSI